MQRSKIYCKYSDTHACRLDSYSFFIVSPLPCSLGRSNLKVFEYGVLGIYNSSLKYDTLEYYY
jgi:hypothetical protein